MASILQQLSHAPPNCEFSVPTALKYIYKVSGSKEAKGNQGYAQDVA
mgnify:CR=1 FL=1